MQELKNPFDDVTRDKKHRTTIDIPLDITAEIKRVEPKTGVLQATTGVLFTRLYEQLRLLNLDTGDRAAFHVAVGGLTVTLGAPGPNAEQRSATAVAAAGCQPSSPVKTPNRNVKRRASGVGKQSP